MIKIIDCGSQLTQNIARRVRERGVHSVIVPYNKSLEEILFGEYDGKIISGGQFSVYDSGAPLPPREILEDGTPTLGICYGNQWIAHALGGKVEPTQSREYGKTRIKIMRASPIFSGIDDAEFDVWMSHGDIVKEMPSGFEVVALSESGHIAAMQNNERRIYTVQFHPEVDHTAHGRKMLENFLDVCNAKRDWNQEDVIASIISRIRDEVKDGIAIAGVSGGVDSTTLAVLMDKALGNKFYAISVDNGLLRKNEGREVEASLAALGINLIYVDESERFLEKLKGVINPDEKRKVIGNEFIAVFDERASRLRGVKYLGQGTLYPDVIESVPVFGCSSKIKRHHNVGGLPEKMNLKLIEPFRELFKDEVRQIAERLNLPREITWRHPFPGPGLAVRIIGEVTNEKLEMLRDADYIFVEELKKRDLYYKIAQAFAVLTNAQAVGVMGDEGTYQCAIVLRAVTTNDFMTADWYDFNKNDLTSIANRIINEVKGINRVVYDVSQKPPSTIEWE